MGRLYKLWISAQARKGIEREHKCSQNCLSVSISLVDHTVSRGPNLFLTNLKAVVVVT